VFGDQVLHQANALQPRARAQRLAHLCGADAGNVGNGGVGLGRVVDLELHQYAAQVPLVARQRAIEQQGALGLVELQQARERVDVLFYQRAVLLEGAGQPLAGHRQHGQQVFGGVFGVFVQVEEQRAFFIRAAPHAVALQESACAKLPRGRARTRCLCSAGPKTRAGAASAGAGHTRWRPGQREQAVQVAPHIELAALLGRQRQHKVRAHQVQHRRVREPGGRQQLRTRPNALTIDNLQQGRNPPGLEAR
jgi:hypothetical protein